MEALIGIVYSVATGRIRWMLHPDRDSELDAIVIRPGEALLRTPNPVDVIAAQALVNAATKKTPANDRYALVNAQGDVVGAIVADPLLDAVPGLALKPHDQAGAGWKWDLTKGFTAPPLPAPPLLTDEAPLL